jgi:hypothetical protein
MKMLLALAAVAVAAVALYATAAPAGQQAVTPRQFNALKAQVAKLQKDVNTLKAEDACLTKVVGVASYGGNDGSVGYHFKMPDGSEILTTALDLVGQGDTPDYFLQEVDANCVSSFRLGSLHAARTRH